MQRPPQKGVAFSLSCHRKKSHPTPLAQGAGNMIYYALFPFYGDIAQLVERLNGIEKVRGSTPLISTTKVI